MKRDAEKIIRDMQRKLPKTRDMSEDELDTIRWVIKQADLMDEGRLTPEQARKIRKLFDGKLPFFN